MSTPNCGLPRSNHNSSPSLDMGDLDIDLPIEDAVGTCEITPGLSQLLLIRIVASTLGLVDDCFCFPTAVARTILIRFLLMGQCAIKTRSFPFILLFGDTHQLPIQSRDISLGDLSVVH